ncbi:MAG TPA: Fic family protein [Campylobacterales bacterium]|nr:Fic family protein [Campylobacterales bacterium]
MEKKEYDNSLSQNKNLNEFKKYGLYTTELDPQVNSYFSIADELNNKIQTLKNKNSELWNTILQKLKIDWTYNSNSIEGSTLTRGDTHFFLTEGLTVEGKPFKDFIDTKNHSNALDWLYEILKDKRELSEGVVKELNALLLYGLESTPATNSLGQKVDKKANAGQYKNQPNHVLLANGDIHYYVEPILVQAQMQELIEWINENIDKIHPIAVASILHYNLVRIHAFDDGNGRGARILMNLVLIKKGFFPAVIKTERKRKYLEAIHEADKGDINPFIQFIATELIETQEKVLNDLK